MTTHIITSNKVKMVLTELGFTNDHRMQLAYDITIDGKSLILGNDYYSGNYTYKSIEYSAYEIIDILLNGDILTSDNIELLNNSLDDADFCEYFENECFPFILHLK